MDDFGHEAVGAGRTCTCLADGGLFRDDTVGVLTGRHGREALDTERGEENLEYAFARQGRGGSDGYAFTAHVRVNNERIAGHDRHIGDQGAQLHIIEVQNVARSLRRCLASQPEGGQGGRGQQDGCKAEAEVHSILPRGSEV